MRRYSTDKFASVTTTATTTTTTTTTTFKGGEHGCVESQFQKHGMVEITDLSLFSNRCPRCNYGLANHLLVVEVGWCWCFAIFGISEVEILFMALF